MTTATISTEEKQNALLALAGRIREHAATGGDGKSEEQLRAIDHAMGEVDHRVDVRKRMNTDNAAPTPTSPSRQEVAGSGIRPISDFLEAAAASVKRGGAPEGPKLSDDIEWPYATRTAEAGPEHDPNREQREVRIMVTGGKWEMPGTLEDILDTTVARADGAPVRIMTGERGGVERLTTEWALKNDLPFDVYPIQWEQGRGAGYRRNEELLAETTPDVVLAVMRGPDRLSRHLAESAAELGIAVEAPITTRVVRSPTGELANLAAASRTPTQAQRTAETQGTAGTTERQEPVPVRPPAPVITSPAVDMRTGPNR